MSETLQTPSHTFHIPVMGTGFTMDTPLRVARYGISSVVSLGDDILMERLRGYYGRRAKLPFEPIFDSDKDCRARRISAWLNFMHGQVSIQSAALRQGSFMQGSELQRYFSLLPEGALRRAWKDMLAMEPQSPMRIEAEAKLRALALPGGIDVNIMTKVDRSFSRAGVALAPDSSDALAGLRGFASSRLESTVVFSAGMNPRLYGYLATFDDFYPGPDGRMKKKVCLKVSDFRSAEIQGKFLAKKGIWVSEFRVESGLNCGGHAFAPQGQLLGPILEEFKLSLPGLKSTLHAGWCKALAAQGRQGLVEAPPIKLSVQGGVGTAAEHAQLLERYGASSVGWGSPFLLVPEAILVDDEQLRKLCRAEEDDIELSDGSPLGIPFWNLRTSSSEDLRRKRIEEGKPGSPCPHSYLIFNTEFGPTPICSSSRSYQRQKLEALEKSDLGAEALAEAKKIVMGHACICVDLGTAILNKLGLEKQAPVAVCPGPGLVWFDRPASLDEMLGHIYGRGTVLSEKSRLRRPHMFLSEIKLTVDFFKREWHRNRLGLAPRGAEYFNTYVENFRKGMRYYADHCAEIFGREMDWLETQVAELAMPVLSANP